MGAGFAGSAAEPVATEPAIGGIAEEPIADAAAPAADFAAIVGAPAFDITARAPVTGVAIVAGTAGAPFPGVAGAPFAEAVFPDAPFAGVAARLADFAETVGASVGGIADEPAADLATVAGAPIAGVAYNEGITGAGIAGAVVSSVALTGASSISSGMLRSSSGFAGAVVVPAGGVSVPANATSVRARVGLGAGLGGVVRT